MYTGTSVQETTGSRGHGVWVVVGQEGDGDAPLEAGRCLGPLRKACACHVRGSGIEATPKPSCLQYTCSNEQIHAETSRAFPNSAAMVPFVTLCPFVAECPFSLPSGTASDRNWAISSLT